MINHIGLKNFKCFEHIEITLAPLTLLTGFNAAGKSSATQGLLLLAQALRQSNPSKLLPLNGQLIELGTSSEVMRQNGGQEISISINSNNEKLTWVFIPGRDRYRNHLTLNKMQVENLDNIEVLEEITINDPVTLCTSRSNGAPYATIENLSNLVYISAVRNGPSDTFPSPTSSDPIRGDVGRNGEFAVWWFAVDLDEEVPIERRHPYESSPILRRQLNAWANELFPGFEANAVLIKGTNSVRLELRTHETDAWRRPANIGYGITYIFPILIAGLLMKPKQTLIVDSPEAHLHPKGQSKVGAFLAKVSDSGVQVIIETHSDHVLNGLRLAVKKELIKSENLIIHFFNKPPRNVTDPAHVFSVWVDRNGNLSEWPDGFFDQSEVDLAKLAGIEKKD